MTTRDFIQYNPDGTLTRRITKKAGFRDCTIRKRIGGRFVVHRFDKHGNMVQEVQTGNLVVNVGIQHLGDILIGCESTNLCLGFIEPDAGTTAVVIGDSDIETPVDACCLDRLAASAQTRNACSPFSGNGSLCQP